MPGPRLLSPLCNPYFFGVLLAGQDFLMKLPNVKVDVTNKLIVDGDGNVLDVQQYDHAGFELVPYKEPEYDYEHQPR